MAPRVSTQAENFGAMGICVGNLHNPAAAAKLNCKQQSQSAALCPLSAVCAFISCCPLLQKQGQNQHNNLRATSRTEHDFPLPSLLIHFMPLLKWYLMLLFLSI